jgi:hypothetical protein
VSSWSGNSTGCSAKPLPQVQEGGRTAVQGVVAVVGLAKLRSRNMNLWRRPAERTATSASGNRTLQSEPEFAPRRPRETCPSPHHHCSKAKKESFDVFPPMPSYKLRPGNTQHRTDWRMRVRIPYGRGG